MRFDLLCEWLNLIPVLEVFPQISHFAIVAPPHLNAKGILSHKKGFCNKKAFIVFNYEKNEKYIIISANGQLIERR